MTGKLSGTLLLAIQRLAPATEVALRNRCADSRLVAGNCIVVQKIDHFCMYGKLTYGSVVRAGSNPAAFRAGCFEPQCFGASRSRGTAKCVRGCYSREGGRGGRSALLSVFNFITVYEIVHRLSAKNAGSRVAQPA